MSVDWERMETLEPYIQRVARYHAGTLGQPAEADELASRIRLAIADRADRDPAFLGQADNFILTLGYWRLLDSLRAERRFSSLPPQPLGILDHLSIELALLGLDPDLQELAQDILSEEFLFSNGRLNVSKLCRATNRTRRWVEARLVQLRDRLVGSHEEEIR